MPQVSPLPERYDAPLPRAFGPVVEEVVKEVEEEMEEVVEEVVEVVVVEEEEETVFTLARSGVRLF